MKPKELRQKAGVSLAAMAKHMGLRVKVLDLLEQIEIGDWTVLQLSHYCKACGFTLQLTAVNAKGAKVIT